MSNQDDDEEDENHDKTVTKNIKFENTSELSGKDCANHLDITGAENDGGVRRSVRRSSFRAKEKKKRLQRLASMPGSV